MQTKKRSLLIILVEILTLKCVICERCETWNSEIPTESIYNCYQHLATNECKYETNTTNVKIHQPNKKEGTVDYEFDFEPHCKYTLKVYVWPQQYNEERCNSSRLNIDDDYETLEHSAYAYEETYKSTNEIIEKKCTQTAIITVKYLYTGCYKFMLFKNNILFLTEDIKYFTLPHQNLSFTDFKLNFYIQHRPKDSKTELEIKHPFVKDHPNLYLTIHCKDCATSSDGVFSITPTLNDYNEMVEYNLFCYNDSTKNINVTCKTLHADIILCNVMGLDRGLYEFSFTFKNLIRCPKCINCLWNYCYSVTEKYINNEVLTASVLVDSNNHSQIVFIILAVAFIIVLIGITVYFIYGNKNKYSDDQITIIFPHTEKVELIGKNKILLLYPKDADIVMETIAALRISFKADGFEVYDVFDKDQQRSIDENKEKWIIDKLADKQMKTIIIQTYCGQIITENSTAIEKLYKKPSCYDSLFPYALSLIRSRVDPNSYTKLFIVNMGFNQMEYSVFNFLNPCVRYGLPQHFKELARDLREKNNCPIDFSESEDEIQEFSLKCEEMKTFIEAPEYLSQVLNVSVTRIGGEIKIQEPLINT